MDIPNDYPAFAAVEHLVRRARAERSLYLGDAISSTIVAGWTAVKWLADLRPARQRASRWVSAGDPFAKNAPTPR